MNKRYFWIKVQSDFFDSDEMDWIHEQPNGAEYIYIYLRLCLLAINNGGVIERRIGKYIIPYEVKKLAELVKSSIDSVGIALSLFKRIGLVEETETGALFIPGFDDMVGSESASARRMRKARAKKNADALPPPQQCDKLLSHCDKKVTKNVTTEIEKDIEIEKELDKKKKPKTRRFSVNDAIDHLVCGEPVKEALKEWAAMRKDIKKPVSERALSMALDRLKELCGTSEDSMVAVIHQSVFNDWQGFFPLKDRKGSPAPSDRREEVKKAVEKGSW